MVRIDGDRRNDTGMPDTRPRPADLCYESAVTFRTEAQTMAYANFWQRFAAMWIDVLVLLPIMFVQMWLEPISKTAAIVMVIPAAAAWLGYSIYCHGRYGQTLGKRAMAIRVVRTTGERIDWDAAWMRSSVDLVFAALACIGSLIALSAIADSQYYGVDMLRRAENLKALEPSWLAWAYPASQIWAWSEVVVMLLNKQRRALHDFLAGTIVVQDPPKTATQTA